MAALSCEVPRKDRSHPDCASVIASWSRLCGTLRMVTSPRCAIEANILAHQRRFRLNRIVRPAVASGQLRTTRMVPMIRTLGLTAIGLLLGACGRGGPATMPDTQSFTRTIDATTSAVVDAAQAVFSERNI